MNSTQWKKDVRNLWKKPLGVQEEKELLTEGELTLARNVNRKEFLDSFDHEDDDFARGIEWRAVDDTDSDVGDIILIRIPNAPHERTAAALIQAVQSFIARNTPNLSIAGAIMPTGSTRCSGGSRSSESDGGFCPEARPGNRTSGEGESNVNFELLGLFPFLQIILLFVDSFGVYLHILLYVYCRCM
jgi:hypothetical protein